ncbi:family 1 glycosylhydrolase [Streptomyces mirabilis]
MTRLAPGFLWGAATAPHQVEGNNVNSDWWQRELRTPGMEHSGDAVDSYHRYPEDMRLLAEAGLNSYRFGIEWARVEPNQGQTSRAVLAHYRRMIDTAVGFGLTPVVTLHHFTGPRWFAEDEGWLGPKGIERFKTYVRSVTDVLGGVEWVCTMNEPNMLALMVWMSDPVRSAAARKQLLTPTVADGEYPVLPDPDPEVGLRLAEAHHAAREILKRETDAKVGWTVANQALTATPGNEAKLREVRYIKEDLYLEAARGDDFI